MKFIERIQKFTTLFPGASFVAHFFIGFTFAFIEMAIRNREGEAVMFGTGIGLGIELKDWARNSWVNMNNLLDFLVTTFGAVMGVVAFKIFFN